MRGVRKGKEGGGTKEGRLTGERGCGGEGEFEGGGGWMVGSGDRGGDGGRVGGWKGGGDGGGGGGGVEG